MTKLLRDLDTKLIRDFHFHELEKDSTWAGHLPVMSARAAIFISSRLQENEKLLIYIEGGGCHGLQYVFEPFTEEPKYEAVEISTDPGVYIDIESLQYMWGSIIELSEEEINKYLIINNPYAKQTCGCFGSFSIE